VAWSNLLKKVRAALNPNLSTGLNPEKTTAYALLARCRWALHAHRPNTRKMADAFYQAATGEELEELAANFG
jgi:hypothetical protein